MNSIATGYQLVKAFYNELGSNEAMQLNAKPHHMSLYTWICELRNRTSMEVVDLPREYTMKMSLIGSPTTLKNCIHDLVEWGIIEVLTVGKNDWTGSTKVKLSCSFLNKHCTATENLLFENEQQPNSSSTTAVQQPNTTKTNKTDKTSKTKKSVPPPKSKVVFRENVQLLQTEFDTLVTEYGPAFTDRCLDKLSHYKLSKGKTYKSDYGAIRQWVIEALQEKQNRNGPPGTTAATTTTVPPPPKDRPLR